MTARIFLAAVMVELAAFLTGPIGGVDAASVAVAWAGWELRTRYAPAAPPILDLSEARMEPVETPRRLEQISGQLAIGMSDGRYFERVVRPLLLRIATGLVTRPGKDAAPDNTLFGGVGAPGRAPTLQQLTSIVDQMEQW